MPKNSGPNTKPRRTAVASSIHAASLDETVSTPIQLTPQKTIIEGVPGNQIWNDLLEKYYSCAQLLMAPSTLLPLLRNAELVACIDNRQNADRISSIISSDLIKFTDYLKRIYDKHSDKRGGTMDVNELMFSNMLYNEYVSFAEQFNANVIPMVISLTEILAVAEKKLTETHADAMLQTQKELDEIAQNVVGVRLVDKTSPLLPQQDVVESEPVAQTN